MKIIILLFVAIFTVATSYAQTSQPLILSQYKPSDQKILSEIAFRSIGKRPSCPGQSCTDFIDGWVRELNKNVEDKQFLDGLGSKPPHIRSQTLITEFNERYQRLVTVFKDDICLDASNWSLNTDQSAYYVGTPGRGVVYLETNLDSITRLIVPEAGGKVLRGIQNQFVTEAVYSRLQALLKYPTEDKKSFVRACGRIGAEFIPPPQPGAIPDPETLKYRFALSRPMEIIRPGESSRLTLPIEWFRN